MFVIPMQLPYILLIPDLLHYHLFPWHDCHSAGLPSMGQMHFENTDSSLGYECQAMVKLAGRSL